ncbi:uncharacterized protein BJ171DRAFT_505642 [Polychytrium aggregatum]|uniref:uncharacterized protein n=1 Tax=Polychytrium aggregatum TaxID=110093 RepID=UPI0022FED046|nr:uncharacterized protein BJ171DRAFT_505642 [Polychytrium aggregatum]KAI9204375.1 hypothetical protein BJ171DRAFT_505642 [Polychytrium aggregatum]
MSTAFAHKGVRFIFVGWTAFIAENLILSQNRDYLIDKLGGEDNYHHCYNTLSTLACASIAWGYFRHGRGQGPTFLSSGSPTAMVKRGIFGGSVPIRLLGFGLQALGFVGISQSFPKLQIPVAFSSKPNALGPSSLTPQQAGSIPPAPLPAAGLRMQCPIDFKPADVPADGIYGVQRVTRHPSLWSLGLLGLGSAIATPFLSEFVLFGFPVVFALIGGAHQDYRFRRAGTLTPEKDAKTSLIPFAALLEGRQEWAPLKTEIKWVNASAGILVALGLALRREMRWKRLLKSVK